MKEKRMDVSFRKRLQQRLHYGDMANLDVPSLPLTELAVDCFRTESPEKLGHVDLDSASNVIRCNKVSPCSVVLSMMYAKRLQQQKEHNKILLNTMSSADVFFISMMMASKYLYDEGVEEEVFNDVWADNMDQEVDDINKMEIDFLQALDWKLFVRPQEFEDTLTAIERRLALQEGLKRGWYTYTEMDVLMNSDLMWMLWSNVGSECSRLLSVISAAYVTSLLSMMGSTALAVHVSGHLSSLTLSLLTLPSSSLMLAVFSGHSPPMSTLSPLSVHSLIQDVPLKRNDSELSAAVSDPSQELKTWGLDAEWNQRPGSLETVGFKHNDRDSAQTADGTKHVRDDSTHMKSSSLWSLWFFDSLVSQMWAVLCSKFKLAHCLNRPSSASQKPGSFNGDQLAQDFLDTPWSQTHCGRTRTTIKRASRTSCKGIKQALVATEFCWPGDVGIRATVDSGHSCDCSSLAYEWCNQAQTSLAQDCHKTSCKPDIQDLSQAKVHGLDFLTSPECIRHKLHQKTDKKLNRQTKIDVHLQSEPTRGRYNNDKISLKLQTRLPVIPSGFHTSLSHSVLVT